MVNRAYLEGLKDVCFNCSYCRVPEHHEISTGEIVFDSKPQCRRNPPKPDSAGVGRFPVVSISDWCGSFKRRA